MLDTASYLPALTGFEGSIPWMYLDKTGNVTVGVGNLLANLAAAQALPFVLLSDPTVSATPDQIADGFNAVRALSQNQTAGFYRIASAVKLTDSAIQNLLAARVNEFLVSLTAASAFPDYNSYPAPACAAIFDMAFNLGLHKLTSGFPHLCAAVQAQDWTTAAAQCQRGGIQNSRNSWTNTQFQAALSA